MCIDRLFSTRLQLVLLDELVLVGVAHVEYDPELVVRAARRREEDDGVEKLLEGDHPVAVLVDDPEHLAHEHVARPHPHRARELVPRQGSPHHREDVVRRLLKRLLSRFWFLAGSE